MKKFTRFIFVSFLAIVCAVIFVVASSLWLPLEQAPVGTKRYPFAIEHVNIINVDSGTLARDMTVIVESGKITSINPSGVSAGVSVSGAEIKRIDGTGKYLLPGLWDMHTHSLKLSPQLHHPLFIANGVTSVRDMSGCMSEPESNWACINDRRQWTTEAVTGRRVSPRYVLQSSHQTNGGNEVPTGFPDYFRLQQPGDAEQLVTFYQQAGADFIKSYSELSPRQYHSLTTAASAANVAVAGHRPLKISLLEAIHAGQKSIEHPRLFHFECYRDSDSFRALADPIRHYNTELMQKLISEFDPDQCRHLMEQMADSNTWWVPTLGIIHNSANATNAAFLKDPRLSLIPAMARMLIWMPDLNRAAEDVSVHQAFYQQTLKHLKLASDAGVKLLVGSDSIDSYIFSGSSVHDEMARMVDAGLSTADVLRAATLSAARFSGRDHRSGSIAVGKDADMLLLAGNPLDDIRQTRSLDGVVFNGMLYDKQDLKGLTEFVEAQAGSIHMNIRYLWDMFSSPLWRVQIAD